jgi:N-acetylneuraminate synthase/N,N'-diacetyllegionaminate synthase
MNFRTLPRTWIVAEIGVNHEGNEQIAHDLIRAAATAGADAVKFQTYVPEDYVSRAQPERLAAVRTRALSREAFRRLARTAAEAGITFFSTPLGLSDVDFLDEIAPIFKVASGEITWLDLIRRIAATGKPMVVSTGLALESEIEAAIEAVLQVRPSARADGSLLLMHCVTAYPTPAAQANLANIRRLIDRFALPVGYSDHTLGIKACELAIAAGAVALEKHFTYRKEDQAFRDHQLSADPADMQALVAAVRQAEVFVGRYERERGEAELANLAAARRSLAARVDLAAGAPLAPESLTALRPLWGIPIEQSERVLGRRLTRAVAAGEIIREEDLVE